MGRPLRSILPLLASLVLAACGGGSDTASTAIQPVASVSAQDSNAPQLTGNTATDGLNWFNFRRQQMGVAPLARNSGIDAAAQGHSDYQKTNNLITHEQTAGKSGFTGINLGERLAAAGYQIPQGGYAYGEVISATSDPSGFNAAEDLISAIYHRFVIFEPMFKESGVGAATVAGGVTYFTANFAAIGLDGGLHEAGKVVTYPFANQQRVERNFFSDNEAPDPVPGRNEVGYPISVHADITATLTVKSFTVRPRGGAPLEVQTLTRALDPKTPTSGAAIVPLNVLTSATTYDVQFSGTVNGVDVDHNWSFATQ